MEDNMSVVLEPSDEADFLEEDGLPGLSVNRQVRLLTAQLVTSGMLEEDARDTAEKFARRTNRVAPQ